MKEPLRPTAANLAHQPFFHGMAWNHLETLASVAGRTAAVEGTLLFTENEAADFFYCILGGKVAIEAVSGGKTLQIQVLEAGDVLGWSWMFPPHQWHFSARAIEPVTLFFFDGKNLRERCEDDPALGYALMKRLTAVVLDRLQATRHRLAVVQQAAAGIPIRIAPLAPSGEGH
jgi:CRP-like cAMP-binding protein